MSGAGRLRSVGSLPPDVSRETVGQLEALVEILAKWQKAINLIGKTTLDDAWTRHIVDSAQLTPHIPAGARRLADLGSGAGFPGLVLAALRPDLDVTLIESDARKGAFLGEAGRRMGLAKQPKIVIARIEKAPPTGADVVTARALAPLKQLLVWADRHRQNEGSGPAICLFHKGKGWEGELTEARRDWDIEASPFPSTTDRDAVLLRIDSYSTAHLRDRQPEGRGR